jgi:DMSO/TMAO reductase YedYZ molybdopterin-dependent catalytic subunit
MIKRIFSAGRETPAASATLATIHATGKTHVGNQEIDAHVGLEESRRFVIDSWDPRSQLTEKDISPYFWPNGTMPKSAEFELMAANNFADYRLRIRGLVESPSEFSHATLKTMPKQEQITTHFCIQGWSGVAK